MSAETWLTSTGSWPSTSQREFWIPYRVSRSVVMGVSQGGSFWTSGQSGRCSVLSGPRNSGLLCLSRSHCPGPQRQLPRCEAVPCSHRFVYSFIVVVVTVCSFFLQCSIKLLLSQPKSFDVCFLILLPSPTVGGRQVSEWHVVLAAGYRVCWG